MASAAAGTARITLPRSSFQNLPRRPRIGVDLHDWDTGRRRSDLLALYRAAIPMAPDLDFVVFAERPGDLREAHPAFQEPNVRVVAMPARGALWRLGWQLPRLQRLEGLDLLHVRRHVPFRPGSSATHGAVACTVPDLLAESHPEHVRGLRAPMMRWMGRRAVRRADLLFAVSDYTRGELARRHGVDPARVALTPPGVDPLRFRPGPDGVAFVQARGLEPGRYVCTVGRVDPRKNHLNLLRALAQMPRPRLPLVFIGPCDVKAVQGAVRELNLSDDVIILDTVDDLEYPALLRHAALFLYPSYAEGFGMPVVEALASGVAVVVSDRTALPEVSGGTALTVSPDDPTEIAAAALALLADPVRRQVLAGRGRAHVLRYRWELAAEVLLARLRRHFRQDPGAGSWWFDAALAGVTEAPPP